MKERILKICDFVVLVSVAAVIFFVPVYFSWVFKTWNAFELPKTVIFRYFLSIGLLAWLLKVFIIGKIESRLPKGVLWIFLSLILAWLLSSLFSIDQQLSLWGKYQRQQGFVSSLSYVLFFFLAFFSIDTSKRLRLFLGSMLASSFLVCLYGFVQFFGLDPVNWAEPFNFYQRAFSCLGQPNFFGHYLVIVLPLTVYCALFLSQKTLPRFLLLLLAVMELACLYYTKSRSAWLGFFGEIWLLSFFWMLYRRKRRMLFGLFAVSAFFLVATIVVSSLPKGQHGLWETNRLASSLNLTAGSTKMRLHYWSGAIKELSSATLFRIFFGYGQETLADISVHWYRPNWGVWEKMNMWPDRVHNFALDSILSVGFLGFSLSLLAVVYFFSKTLYFLKVGRRDGDYWLALSLCLAFFGYFVNNFFSFSMTTHYVYFYFLLAGLSFVIFSAQPKRTIDIRLTVLSRGLIFSSIFLFLGIFVFYRGAMSLKADYSYSVARHQEASSNCQALEFIRAAAILNPEESLYREEYVFNALGCFETLREARDKAVLRDNIEMVLDSFPERRKGYYEKLAEANAISLFSSDADKNLAQEADRLFSEVIEEYSNIDQPYLYYAYHKMRQGDFAGAIELSDRGKGLLPPLTIPINDWNHLHRQRVAREWASFCDVSGLSAAKLGDYDRAIEEYDQLLKADPFNLPVYKRIADIYYLEKDIDKALWYNKRGHSLNKNDYSWPLAIAILLKESGDKDGSDFYFSEAKRLGFAGNDSVSEAVSDIFSIDSPIK